MPTKWTPELDSILLHGVFEECNISFSKALCGKIAERVSEQGIECTAKAVENRLYSWKKKNVTGGGGTPVKPGRDSPAKAAATTTTTPKTPRARAKGSATKKARTSTPVQATEGHGHESGHESPSVKRGGGNKRAREVLDKYAEQDAEDDDDESMSLSGGVKRVKKEPVEEKLLSSPDMGDEDNAENEF
ncbi:hypothetical protein ACEQ8H_000289 [Pleosporales sp. CAS-2024a]